MLRRSISNLALLFASISPIMGSGWLFAALYTTQLTGPSAILAWVMGGIAAIVIAFVFAELTAMLPITGSSTRIPQFTHGTMISFMFAWMIWLSYATLSATEVQAVVQYLSFLYPQLVHVGGGLTKYGYMLATCLMLLISAINIFSLRWLMRCNNILTVLKILIPIFISLALMTMLLKPHHPLIVQHQKFMAYGTHGFLAAITTGGIAYAFTGFKQACEMAGEVKNPQRAIPIAIIGSIVICMVIFLMLQLGFIASLTPADIANGWDHITLRGGNSPFAAILAEDHFNYLLPVLYIGAIIAPLAAGLMYVNSAGRSLYAQSKNGYLPIFFQHVSTQGNPIFAIVTNFALAMFLFMPFPGWQQMITFLTSIVSLTYIVAPVSLLALRKQIPDQHRPFRLKMPRFWSFFVFYLCTLMTYWSGWFNISKLGVAMFAGLAILMSYRSFSERGKQIEFNWEAATWIWPYLVGIMLISYLGNFGGGRNVIPFGWDFPIIGVFCLGILYLSQKFRLPADKTRAYVGELNLE